MSSSDDLGVFDDQKDYLGDGVYAEFDGYHVVIYTSNGITNSPPIAIEPAVMAALNRYYNRVWKRDS